LDDHNITNLSAVLHYGSSASRESACLFGSGASHISVLCTLENYGIIGSARSDCVLPTSSDLTDSSIGKARPRASFADLGTYPEVWPPIKTLAVKAPLLLVLPSLAQYSRPRLLFEDSFFVRHLFINTALSQTASFSSQQQSLFSASTGICWEIIAVSIGCYR
jgi:hypothetical protein